MKRSAVWFMLMIFTLLVLSACSCEHKWTNASCIEPKICMLCGETEGEPLGHSWVEATCGTPKACVRCNEVGGVKLGHSWDEATCDTPKTCTVCSVTKGESTGHSWENWICTETDACRICKSCGVEEVITMSDYLVTQLQGCWISTEDLFGTAVSPDRFTTFEIRADGTVGLYSPFGTYPSCKLEFVPSAYDSGETVDKILLGFTLTADGVEKPFNFLYFQQEDFIHGYLGLCYERESAEAATVREMLQGEWIFDSAYTYDDALAEQDHSGYTVEFHEGNKFIVCAEKQFEGTWIYYPDDQFESDGITYYSILAIVGEDWWSTYFTLEVHSDSGAVILRVERPRAERTEFVKTE